jgi:hypothetical protein
VAHLACTKPKELGYACSAPRSTRGIGGINFHKRIVRVGSGHGDNVKCERRPSLPDDGVEGEKPAMQSSGSDGSRDGGKGVSHASS